MEGEGLRGGVVLGGHLQDGRPRLGAATRQEPFWSMSPKLVVAVAVVWDGWGASGGGGDDHCDDNGGTLVWYFPRLRTA